MSEVRVFKREDPIDRLLYLAKELNAVAEQVSEDNELLKAKLERYKSDDPQDYAEDSKTERVERIAIWANNGFLVLRSDMGGKTAVAKKIKAGELYPTSYGSLLATCEEVRDAFEYYYSNGLIMDSNKLAASQGYTTRFAIQKACDRGDIKRVDCFGDKIGLYAV